MTKKFLKFFRSIKTLPSPGDKQKAKFEIDRWLAQATKGDAHSRLFLAEYDDGKFLKAIFGNSTFLTRSIMREPSFFLEILEKGPLSVSRSVLKHLELDIGQQDNLTKIMDDLRKAKRQIAILVAIADIGGHWSINQITSILSQFADKAVNLAVRFGLRQLTTNGQLNLSNCTAPEKSAGYVIIGVGKLGAQELNYSSDIDLMAIYDPAHINVPNPTDLSRIMIQLTRLIIKILEEKTQNGYVFRTDFRIRPAPGSTPIAISIESAMAYYESVGQNWERLAMIRARPVAGDMSIGSDFISRIQPFIWRRNLDFASIRDVHAVKRQIAAYRGGKRISIKGHNIKVGRGGIREIEFFVQTQQVIWGGRIPELRTRDLVETLNILAKETRISHKVAEDLANAYTFLRHLEHRLQMVDDRQTHDLPKTEEGLAIISKFAGFHDTGSLKIKLLDTLKKVEFHYDRLFKNSRNLGAQGNLVFTGVENDQDTLVNLTKIGFTNPNSISEAVRNWHRGKYRATRTERARQILTELIPNLLKTIGSSTQPNKAFIQFDAFLKALPSGVQTLSLFANSPKVLDLVINIMGNAPNLALRLSKNPGLLDNILSRDFYHSPGNHKDLDGELKKNLHYARDFEDQLDIARRWTNDKKFQNGTQLLLGTIEGYMCCKTLSDVAEIALQAMFACVRTEFEKIHGVFETGDMAILAFGKLGSRELMQESDLDLVFVYNHLPMETKSNGIKPLSANIYFMRLAQRIITSLTVLTSEGKLYSVDTRLRPHGKKGPIASHILSFERYYATSAWTWEYMALSRARVVVGSAKLLERIKKMQRSVLMQRRNQTKLKYEVTAMRGRIAARFPGTEIWDIKYKPGGLVDIEFIAQYLQLQNANAYPEILSPNTISSLGLLKKHGHLTSQACFDLIEGYKFWHNIGSILRITATTNLENIEYDKGPQRMLAQAGGVPTFDKLIEKINQTSANISMHYKNILGNY